jgi:hypothetical protein
MKPRDHFYLAAAAAGLLIASCAPEPERQSNETAPESPAAPAARAPPAESGENAAATAPAPAPATADRPKLAAEAEGLRLFVGAGGSARALPFGMAREQLLAPLESYRGPADGGTHAECGAGPLDYAVWADGITLYFQEGRFAGWALDERAEGAHSTASGIGPGSTRAELDAAYDAKVSESSLGTEFTAGGLSGVLNGKGSKAKITNMWAGVSCVFR